MTKLLTDMLNTIHWEMVANAASSGDLPSSDYHQSASISHVGAMFRFGLLYDLSKKTGTLISDRREKFAKA